MTDALTHALDGLPRPIALIAHLGAGPGEALDRWRASGAETVLLVEAEPEAAAELSARAAGDKRVKVVHAAVSADPRPRPFHVANFADLSSLRAPAPALRELFPGLRIVSDEVVTPRDPVSVLGESLPGEDRGSALLVLETPGETLGILEALEKADALHRFDAICLQEGVEPLHDGAAPLAEIRDRLARAGYDLRDEAQPEDPDRPRLIARLDRAALRLRELKTETEAQKAEIARLRDAAKASEAELGTLREANAAAKTEIAALAKAQGELKTLREALTTAEAARDTAESRLRQTRAEMLRAEGQIRLLRDLLIDGPLP